MKTKLAAALLALGMLTGILLTAPPARGAVSVALGLPKYHGTYYVPGEQLQFTVSIQAGDPTMYDILVVWDDRVNPRINWSGNQFDDITVTGTSIVLTFGILPVSASPAMRDGDWYAVEVHDSQWIEFGGTGPGRVTFTAHGFMIRTYVLTMEYDRGRYLPGDLVTVHWSANMIRDSSLAPINYDGQLWVFDWPTQVGQITPNPHLFNTPSGSFQFRLNNLIPTNRLIIAYAWYNSTRSNADRYAFAISFASIDGLQLMLSLGATSYEPGGVVTADISAKVTDFGPFLGDPGAAGVIVDVTVTNQRTGLVEAAYGATNLTTDIHGNVRHVFPLGTAIQDGTSFLVSAHGVFQNGPQDTITTTFVVNSRAGMTIALTFDKSQYKSGDTATMTVAVSGSTGPFTFTYEARDASTLPNLLDRQTSTSTVYQYAIPVAFDGSILFTATVDDGQGNRRSASRQFTVLLGVLVVNLDRSEYNGGDTVTASYALTVNPGVLTNPTYYYEIFDTSAVPILVKSGVAAGSVSYQVPSVPASAYMFRITAAAPGRSLSGSATALLVSGVILSISFDRTSYNPGDTMRISYSLTPRGRTALPSTFLFYILLAGSPLKTVQTTAAAGELTYTIPAGTNTGQLSVSVLEFYTTASASEVVTVGGVNPLWSDVGGIPAIVVVMGLFLVLAYIVIMLMWRRMMPGMAPRAPGEKPPHMERPEPPATARPGPAPMSVTCKACGSPIEITTSRRPIEVMCPSCGETQMVQ